MLQNPYHHELLSHLCAGSGPVRCVRAGIVVVASAAGLAALGGWGAGEASAASWWDAGDGESWTSADLSFLGSTDSGSTGSGSPGSWAPGSWAPGSWAADLPALDIEAAVPVLPDVSGTTGEVTAPSPALTFPSAAASADLTGTSFALRPDVSAESLVLPAYTPPAGTVALLDVGGAGEPAPPAADARSTAAETTASAPPVDLDDVTAGYGVGLGAAGFDGVRLGADAHPVGPPAVVAAVDASEGEDDDPPGSGREAPLSDRLLAGEPGVLVAQAGASDVPSLDLTGSEIGRQLRRLQEPAQPPAGDRAPQEPFGDDLWLDLLLDTDSGSLDLLEDLLAPSGTAPVPAAPAPVPTVPAAPAPVPTAPAAPAPLDPDGRPLDGRAPAEATAGERTFTFDPTAENPYKGLIYGLSGATAGWYIQRGLNPTLTFTDYAPNAARGLAQDLIFINGVSCPKSGDVWGDAVLNGLCGAAATQALSFGTRRVVNPTLNTITDTLGAADPRALAYGLANDPGTRRILADSLRDTAPPPRSNIRADFALGTGQLDLPLLNPATVTLSPNPVANGLPPTRLDVGTIPTANAAPAAGGLTNSSQARLVDTARAGGAVPTTPRVGFPDVPEFRPAPNGRPSSSVPPFPTYTLDANGRPVQNNYNVFDLRELPPHMQTRVQRTTDGAIAGMNIAGALLHTGYDELLRAWDLKDNYPAYVIGHSGINGLTVGTAISLAERRLVPGAFLHPTWQSVVAQVASDLLLSVAPPQVRQAAADTCSDENGYLHAAKWFACNLGQNPNNQGGLPPTPPTTPPDALSATGLDLPAATGGAPFTGATGEPGGVFPVMDEVTFLADVPAMERGTGSGTSLTVPIADVSVPIAGSSLPTSGTSPVTTGELPATWFGQPSRPAPLPDGRPGVVVDEQQLTGTGRAGDSPGVVTTVEDPQTGQRYVSVQPTRVTNPDGTQTLFIPQPAGTRVGYNPTGRTAAVFRLDEGATGRVTAQTPVQQVTVRTSPGTPLEFNGGGGPHSVPGIAYRDPVPGNPAIEEWTVFPASHLDPDTGVRRYSAQVPAGYERQVDLSRSGVVQLRVPAGSRPVTVTQTEQAFTPYTPPAVLPAPAAAPRPAPAALQTPRPAPTAVRTPQPAPTSPPAVRNPPAATTPTRTSTAQPNLLERGLEVLSGGAGLAQFAEANKNIGEAAVQGLGTLYDRAVSGAQARMNATIIGSQPLDGVLGFGVTRHQVTLGDGSVGIYDPEGALVDTVRGNPPRKVSGQALFNRALGRGVGLPGAAGAPVAPAAPALAF
jgi:hypothetical protein